MWTPLFGTAYEVDGYLSPLFSPLIAPAWLPAFISPGLLILWIPLGFRATCYYYRKAYYRFYFADPPGCAVGEPTVHKRYSMETSVPVHPPELPPLLPVPRVRPAVLPVGRRRRCRCVPESGPRLGLGSVIFFVNVALLSAFSLSCNSLRHLVGGRVDCFSCTRRRRSSTRCGSGSRRSTSTTCAGRG